MRIRVIGSGSMWNEYNSACYLIDDNIIIDFPNGACKYLYRFGVLPNKIDNIVLTHFHGDHYFDIPFYILNKSKNKSKTVNIFCSKDGKTKISKLGKLAFQNSFKEAINSLNLKYNYNDKFIINNYEVKRLTVDHGRMKPAYGYVFTKDNTKVGFTGDTTICSNVACMASVCNYLFCDCMFINGTKKHMGIDMLKKLSTKYENCIFVASHLENETRKELVRLNIKNIIIPDDGQIISI